MVNPLDTITNKLLCPMATIDGIVSLNVTVTSLFILFSGMEASFTKKYLSCHAIKNCLANPAEGMIHGSSYSNNFPHN